MRYDLAVIGSGAAAFAAAISARNKGRRVVMIERDTVGGTCVNTGCVPSKALLAAADARHVARADRFPGITTHACPVELATLIGATRDLTHSLRAEKYTGLAAEYDWDIVAGHARFTTTDSGPILQVDLAAGGRRRVEAEHYLIATGSTPWTPPIDGLAAADYLTSTSAMELERPPESMIVIGGNAVGLEQAQLWARLGAHVTVLETRERLAPFEEPDVSEMITAVFTDEHITVHTATTPGSVHRESAGYTVTALRQGQPIEVRAEHLLVATGRRPAADGLNLPAVDVAVGPLGEVVVDQHLRSTNARIWAAGDVTGSPQFVYVAGAQGALVTDNAFDQTDRTLDYRHLPRVTFTSPAIASAGMTGTQAQAAGIACDCRVLPLRHVPRALVNRDTRGLIKLVAQRDTGRLLGAHIVADGAGDIIATAVYALTNQMTVQQMAAQWCPYLTMAEGLKLAAQTFTRDVTKLSCCAA